jgi:hypothetical protein
MELARHSDMRLTMKTYTDVAQLPLAATVRGLPSIGDSQIDSQTLAADRPTLSPAVIGVKSIKAGKTIENIDESRNLTSLVALCHSGHTSGEMGFESLSPPVFFCGFSPMLIKIFSAPWQLFFKLIAAGGRARLWRN